MSRSLLTNECSTRRIFGRYYSSLSTHLPNNLNSSSPSSIPSSATQLFATNSECHHILRPPQPLQSSDWGSIPAGKPFSCLISSSEFYVSQFCIVFCFWVFRFVFLLRLVFFLALELLELSFFCFQFC